MKKTLKVVTLIFSFALLITGIVAFRIYSYGQTAADLEADAAIVLGAAVWGADVSPVFRERINHALTLYRVGKIKKLIFTGGQGNSGELTESAAAREYAISRGVSAEDILIEEKSHTTYENIRFAKELMDARGLKKVLIVTDPLHMKRAMAMCQDLGIEAYPSPTPTTRYQSIRSQAGLLVQETYYYFGYLFRRVFQPSS